MEGPARLTGCAVEVPRDPSSAAFAIVAALIVPGSKIELPGIARRLEIVSAASQRHAVAITRNWSGPTDIHQHPLFLPGTHKAC